MSEKKNARRGNKTTGGASRNSGTRRINQARKTNSPTSGIPTGVLESTPPTGDVSDQSVNHGTDAINGRDRQSDPPKVKVGRAPFHEMLPPSQRKGRKGLTRKASPADEDPQDRSLPGPFPVDALPPVARNLVLRTAAEGRVPVGLPAAAVLDVGAAAIGRGMLVENDLGILPCNLFVALVASSGTGKKLVFDHCVNKFATLHHEVVDEWERQTRTRLELRLKARRRVLAEAESRHRDAMGTAEEEDAERLAVNAANEVAQIERELRCRPTLRLTDPNRLALARAMQGQEGEACAVMSSEAVGGLMGLLGAGMGNGRGSEGFICACHSGDGYSDDRLSRNPITLRNPCLTLLSCIQPDVMSDLLANQRLVDRGLLARFLMVSEDDNADVPERPAEGVDVDGPWSGLVSALTMEYRLNKRGRRGSVTISASAEVRAIFSAYRNTVERDIEPGGGLADLQPFIRRWPEQAARIALVLHALRHGPKAHQRPLAQQTARDAVRIGRWFAAKQVEMLGGHRVMRRRARADKLRSTLLQHPHHTASLGRLSKSHGFDEDEVRALCADFPKLLRLEPRPSGAAGGRPTEQVRAA